MKAVSLVLLLLLSGCADPVGDAEREMQIVSNAGTPDQKCEAHRKLAKAYLTAHREDDYELENIVAETKCRKLRLEREFGVGG